MKRIFMSLILSCLLSTAIAGKQWVVTWAAAPEFTTAADMPPSGSLSNKSVRQIIHVSIGGDSIRLRLSNEFSSEPLEIRSVFIADSEEAEVIDSSTAQYILFGGSKSVTIDAGACAVSDAVPYDLKPLQLLSITICYGSTPVNATSHRGSRTTSYLVDGIATASTDFSNAELTDHWYNIAAVDVLCQQGTEAIAVLGNSITDGRGSTTNAQNRWTDVMAEVLGGNVAVANLGIGGNSVYYGGISQPAVSRFERDILGQSGITCLIIFEGINDLGNSDNDEQQRASKLIECYEEFAAKAHEKGLKVLGATITPFGGSFYDNGSPAREEARQAVNKWIRESADNGTLDGVIDFDAAVRDPSCPSRLREEYQDDWLHLNADGYRVMGNYAAGIVSGN